jgi:hypothetical protein
VIEEQDEDEETKLRRERARRKAKGLEKESLEGLSTELQEALVVEDLLYVLMVSFHALSAKVQLHETDPFLLDRVSKVATSNTTRLTLPKTTMRECKVPNSLLIGV